MKPFSFVNYDKISDNLLFFSYNPSISLKFCVDLNRVDKYNNERSFHNEFKFYSKKFERDSYSINRSYSFYYVINCGYDFKGCMLHMSDVMILNMLIDTQILPWFMGSTRIYSMSEDGNMIINGNWNEVTLPLNEATYIKFSPVIINYEDTNSYKEGIRLEINAKEMTVDITLDKFLEFAYIMKNTDMINLASSMLEYVKTQPYNVNLGGPNEEKQTRHINTNLSNINYSGKKQGNFFDK